MELVDRYRKRVRDRIGDIEPSWFDGMRGKITALKPHVMVHLDGERLPMVFDERDLVVLSEENDAAMVAGE